MYDCSVTLCRVTWSNCPDLPPSHIFLNPISLPGGDVCVYMCLEGRVPAEPPTPSPSPSTQKNLWHVTVGQRSTEKYMILRVLLRVPVESSCYLWSCTVWCWFMLLCDSGFDIPPEPSCLQTAWCCTRCAFASLSLSGVWRSLIPDRSLVPSLI